MITRLFQTKYSHLLKQALDVYGKKHNAIAQNVANANNPGYKRMNTDFSQVLKSANNQSNLKISSSKHIRSSSSVGGKTGSGKNVGGDKVDLTREMTELAETQIKYEFITRMLGRYYNGLSTSIVGRNR